MASPPTARLSNAPSADPRDYDAGTNTAARWALTVSLQTLAQTTPDQFPTAGSGMNSRTSCAQRQAPAFLAAHCSASSREGTSTTQNPPMVSGYGPSVTVPSVATTLAFWVFQSAAENPDAGVHGLRDHLVRGPGHGWHVLVGDVVHRVGIERD
jgi:hypothetical protein